MWPLEEEGEDEEEEEEDEDAAPCWARRRWPQAGCSVLTLLFPCPFSALKKKRTVKTTRDETPNVSVSLSRQPALELPRPCLARPSFHGLHLFVCLFLFWLIKNHIRRLYAAYLFRGGNLIKLIHFSL